MNAVNEAPAAPVTPDQRASILKYATHLLPRRAQDDAGLVLICAAPLLEWAGEADGKGDLAARMDAMSRTHMNAPPARDMVSPGDFLDRARAYYRFIAGTA